jgi:hypothetical protein
MFTIDEKEILMTSLITRRNIIETGNPYISANDVLKRKSMGIITKINPSIFSIASLEEILKINRLITKIQTSL